MKSTLIPSLSLITSARHVLPQSTGKSSRDICLQNSELCKTVNTLQGFRAVTRQKDAPFADFSMWGSQESDIESIISSGCLAAGGWLYQQADSLNPEDIKFTTVSEAQPTEQQLQDLKFSWRSVKHVKSNAITVAKDGRLLGMGSGQPNRVKSVEIALEKAGDQVQVIPKVALPAFQTMHGPMKWMHSI